MKTPEEIKKALRMCVQIGGDCEGCPYDHDGCIDDRDKHDALEYIQQLEAKLAEVERERDAAVQDINESQPCFACKHYHENNGNCRGAKICRTYEFLFETGNERYLGPSWQWRGPCAKMDGE